MTLKKLLEEHPDWADLPIGVVRSDGYVDFVGDSGYVYCVDHCDDEEADVEEAKTRGETYKAVFFATNQ